MLEFAEVFFQNAFRIIIGLIGLGVVVFIHELGHFLAARLVKIDVEAFSIGWGKPFLKKKIGNVEYRLGIFPIGGYCKFKGAKDVGASEYEEVWENHKKGIKAKDGSFLSASPAARILTCFAGPFFNLIFAIVLLSILSGFGFQAQALGNRIILASQINPQELFPADEAGFLTGDRIVQIDNKQLLFNNRQISYFHEITRNISLNPGREIAVMVDRGGEYITLNVTPALDRSTGAGRIGVSPWIDPVIESVAYGSIAHEAGLLPADIIFAVNGEPIQNTFELSRILEQSPNFLLIDFERNGQISQIIFNDEALSEIAARGSLGISWAAIEYNRPRLSPPMAIARGVQEGFETLIISVRSLRVLFMGVDLTQAVSGPVRITHMMGATAAQGFGHGGFGAGLRSLLEFIALISIALCIMNLLPLPIIDGGMIILFFVELIRRKPAHPKVISIFQTCGMVIIFSLLIFAVFGDIMFFIRG